MAIQVGFEIDVAGFRRGIAQIRQGTLSMAADITTVMRGAAAIFQTGASVVQGAAHRMYDAMSEGGELVDLSERTGLAIDKLMELQVAFDQAGIGAAEVGPLVNKMQNAIADAAAGSATGQKTFADLGLSLEELGGMDAAGQMERIGEAVSAIEDPVRRTQASMDIFGKSGGKMLALFASGGSAEARDALGQQAKIMADNAAYFDSITDKLGTAGIKLRGFFVGVASSLVPNLMQAADALNSVDFSIVGKQIGVVLAGVIDVFASGKLGDAFFLSMKIAIMKTINLFVQSFLQAIAVVLSLPIMIGGAIASALEKPLKLAFYSAGKVLLEAVGKAVEMLGNGLQKLPGFGSAGKSIAETGVGIQGKALDFGIKAQNIKGNFGSLKDELIQATSDGLNVYKSMVDRINSIDIFSDQTFEDVIGLKQLFGDSMRAAQEAKRVMDEKKPAREKTNFGLDVIPPGGGRGQSFENITSSMARIGGGGLTAGLAFTVTPMVDQQKTTNKILQQILQKPATGQAVATLG